MSCYQLSMYYTHILQLCGVVSVDQDSQDKTGQWVMSADGLMCILYARIYIPYMRTVLYHYIQTGRPPVPISSELKLKTNPLLVHYLSTLLLNELTESASTT